MAYCSLYLIVLKMTMEKTTMISETTTTPQMIKIASNSFTLSFESARQTPNDQINFRTEDHRKLQIMLIVCRSTIRKMFTGKRCILINDATGHDAHITHFDRITISISKKMKSRRQELCLVRKQRYRSVPYAVTESELVTEVSGRQFLLLIMYVGHSQFIHR